MKKYQCNACGICICTAEYQDGERVPFKCTGVFDMYYKPQWKEIEPEVANLQPKVATLPDWCKVGEWVYADPGKIFGPAGYKKIKATDGLELTFADGCCIYFSDKIKPVRLRPYKRRKYRICLLR